MRLVLAEGHLLREGIRRLIEMEEELELVAVCEDLASLLAAIGTHHPDVVVLLSQYADPQYALAFLEHGSRGRAYLLKELAPAPSPATGSTTRTANWPPRAA